MVIVVMLCFVFAAGACLDYVLLTPGNLPVLF